TDADGDVVNAPRHHQISLMVEDIAEAEATIRARGGEIVTGPRDFSWGTGIEVAVPGTDAILIYEPKHATAYHL
ncbi:MAG TPA: VOC family protein, partial [Phycicoccus sp.]|nr:VOC family protein [Phycicoccus sp.]